jgi:glutamine synthetase
VNFFRRFVPDTLAPVSAEWGEENRIVDLRVPDASPQNHRIENRLPVADANPYLAVAASLLCGYIGMVEVISLSAPVVNGGYERRNSCLPLTREEALARMESSKTIEKYLGTKFIAGYSAVKRAEHENFKRVISSWEQELLLFDLPAFVTKSIARGRRGISRNQGNLSLITTEQRPSPGATQA